MKGIMKKYISIALVSLCLLSCSKGFEGFGPDYIGGTDAPGGSMGDGQHPSSQPGVLTAGEWNDLKNWEFWSGLMYYAIYSNYTTLWGFHTDGRISVELRDGNENPVIDMPVELYCSNQLLWAARTDNSGKAECWLNLFKTDKVLDKTGLRLKIGDELKDDEVKVTYFQDYEVSVNRFTVTAEEACQIADIAFIVDATGSMVDEIDFLKSDLVDILGKAQNFDSELTIRSAAIMYRDIGDEYITRFQDFRENPAETASFIKKQYAEGGGDYPEAVHSALETALQNLTWSSSAKCRIAFLILDAPAHLDNEVKESLHRCIREFAAKGIAIIPVASSGADKDTEFLTRSFAIATNGTYLFLTDDSGIGGEHIKATVGDYTVEFLNDLLTRLIQERID